MVKVTTQRSVCIQGLASLLKGSPEMSENEVIEVLRQIVVARQEGRFPLSEELVQVCRDEVDQVWETYQTINKVPPTDLNTRCILLFCDFFHTVLSEGCASSDDLVQSTQHRYLLQMEEKEGCTHPTINVWVKNFATLSCKC